MANSKQQELDIRDLSQILHALGDAGFRATKSYQLGLDLGLFDPTLSKIDSETTDPDIRLRKCLVCWLEKKDYVETRGGATAEALIQALRNMQEIAVAKKIEQMDLKIALPDETDTNASQLETSSDYKLIPLTTSGKRSAHKAVPLFYPNNMDYDPTTNQLTTKLNGEQRSSLDICPFGMELLENIRKPIAVLSIAGPTRTGKSYILSRVLDSHDAFELGHKQHTQTHGIWIGTQALEYDDHVLVLLDTEGIDAVSADGTSDAKILVMTLLMSSYFIYNSIGVPKNEDLKKMRVFTEFAQYFAQEQNCLRQYFPSFLWLLRDFMVDLEDPQTYEELSPTDYLVQVVLRKNSEQLESDEVRKAILDFFPDLDCFVLPIPSADKKNLREIVKRHDQLTEEFKIGVAKLISNIKDNVTAKTGYKSSEPINGSTLALLAKEYVKALNSPGAVPACLDDIWVAIANQKCTEIENELVKEYHTEMEKRISEARGLPLEVEASTLVDISAPHTIMSIHRFICVELQKRLCQEIRPFLGKEKEDLRKQFEKKLILCDEQGKVEGGVLYEFLQANAKRSQVFCKKMWHEQYQPIEDRRKGDRSYTYDQYTVDFDKACEHYLSCARGPAKLAVLCEAIEEERHYIKQMPGYDDELHNKREAQMRREERKRLIEQEVREEQIRRDENYMMKLQTLENMLEQLDKENRATQAKIDKQLKKEAKKRKDITAHLKESSETARRQYEALMQEKEEMTRHYEQMMKQLKEDLEESAERDRKRLIEDLEKKALELRRSEENTMLESLRRSIDSELKKQAEERKMERSMPINVLRDLYHSLRDPNHKKDKVENLSTLLNVVAGSGDGDYDKFGKQALEEILKKKREKEEIM